MRNKLIDFVFGVVFRLHRLLSLFALWLYARRVPKGSSRNVEIVDKDFFKTFY